MVVLFGWLGAVVVALVVLGFCAYELAWKSRRLQQDLAKLTALTGELTALQESVAATQQRLRESAG